MESIYILGGGGLAKEVYFLIKATKAYEVIAFIDIVAKAPIQFSERAIPVIGESEFLSQKFSELPKLALGIGFPEILSTLIEKFGQYEFPNIFHPSAIFDRENVSFGKGNIIAAGVVMTTAIKIGNFNNFNPNITIGHDCTIGNGNVFTPAVNISGNVEIGNFNFFGVDSTVLQNKKVGNHNVVGASALIIKNIGHGEKLIGIPAKNINST